VTDPIRADIAKRVGGLIWKPPAASDGGTPDEDDDGSKAA